MCMIAIEGMAFALAISSYLYLKGGCRTGRGERRRRACSGARSTSCPAGLRVAEPVGEEGRRAFRPRRSRLADGGAGVRARVQHRAIPRVRQLDVRWDTNAYGSVSWLLLGLHTVHVLTDFLDSTVLAAVMFCGRLDENRFVDVSENAMYWNFVVVSWLPIYAVIYLAPRIV